ncbi:MAG: glycosyltransferase family A protein [Patescibacteria group bacterium]|jgi:glycosyltransferase involved in cell wall biosynthesis
MNKIPLVSIIIPCYQSEKTLMATLLDIFNQTYKNLEVIAVDDGSTDKTQEILSNFKDKLLIIKQKNSGAAVARNRGFDISKGEFILFCDSDVRLKNDMVEKMANTLQSNPDKAYCYSNFRFGVHTFDLFPFNGEKLLKQNYISTMSLIRRSKFIYFDENLKRFQDWDLWKRMYKKGSEGIWFPERLFSAPLNTGGISKFNLTNIIKLLINKFKK